MPLAINAPTPTPVPTPQKEAAKLRFSAVVECGNSGPKQHLAEFVLDPSANTLTTSVIWEDLRPDDVLKIRGYVTPCAENVNGAQFFRTLTASTDSWTYTGDTNLKTSPGQDVGEAVTAFESELLSAENANFPTSRVFFAINRVDASGVSLSGFPLRGWLELDQDDDGLTNREEPAVGTTNTDRDKDDDGLLDGEEVLGWGRKSGSRRAHEGLVLEQSASFRNKL